jgi:hypothetical protein
MPQSGLFTSFMKCHFPGDDTSKLLLLNGFAWKILMLLNCINSLAGGRGLIRDAAEEGGECLRFQIKYFATDSKVGATKEMQSEKTDEKIYDNCGNVITKL